MGVLPFKPSLAYLMYASLLFQGNPPHQAAAFSESTVHPS